jgi:aspartyl-tRNA(Asn)/glutamyl-tRNA(Gln) amidotransferase subunit A
VGPLTRSTRDAAALWAVLTDRPIPALQPRAPDRLRLGALDGYFTALLSSEVRAVFDGALGHLRAAGFTVVPRSVDGTETIVETYTNISLAEAAAWHSQTLDTRPDDYQPPVRSRLELGRSISAVAYLRAQEARVVLRRAVDAALVGCDALVLPTLPIVAPLLGSSEVAMDDGTSLPVRAAMLRLTQLFNVTGHPAISLPVPTDGLPVGLQLVGRYDATRELLDVALSCERVLQGR